MANTQYKRTIVAVEPELADSVKLAYPNELVREPAKAGARAQDTILGGRRILLSRHTGGSGAWLVDDAATGGGTQGKPDSVTWRIVARAKVDLMAGSTLTARVVGIPAGASEYDNTAGGTWDLDVVAGHTRFVVQHVGLASATTTTLLGFSPSPEEDGAQNADDGAAWNELEAYVATGIRPDGAGDSLATASNYSEWPTLTIEHSDRGGTRVIHATIAEEPLEHVVLDTVTASTCNGVPSFPPWPTLFPQEEDADGATYDEHRYGSHRAMHVAERQTARLGARIAHWSAYTEGTAEVDDVEADAFTTASSTYVRISAGPNTSWDEDAVGFDVVESMRAPEHLTTRVDGAASVPVIARVYARFNQAGANTGKVRLQTTARSWLEIPIEQATVGTTWTWVEISGWLESAVASDDGYPVLQDFAKTDGDTLEIRYWDVQFGDY